MAERYYVNCPLAPGPVDLQGPEAHHLAAVCRVRPGQQVCLFNGDGQEYPAEVHAASKRSVRLNVRSVTYVSRELDFPLRVAVPLPKGDRAQFLIEKLTELGVTTFTPLRMRRSVVYPRETRLDKLERYVIEASKQCGRNVLMRIEPLADWDAYCRLEDLPPTRIVAHPESESSRQKAEGGQIAAPPSGVAVAVGPEGGFTDEEIDLGQSAGWQVISLGSRILRVETAALVLAAWVVR